MSFGTKLDDTYSLCGLYFLFHCICEHGNFKSVLIPTVIAFFTFLFSFRIFFSNHGVQ